MEKKGVGRPRDGNPEETRQEILRAAGEAFAASGFVGATTRAVAARAGVNVATLHYHFGSKEGLYRAVFASSSLEALPAVPPGPGRETVASLVEALFAYGADHPTLARLSLLDALSGPDAAAGGRPDPRVRWLGESIRAYLKPVNGRPAPAAEETARSIVALVDTAFVATASRAPSAATEDGGGSPPEAPAGPPNETVRAAVVAAALRLTGLD